MSSDIANKKKVLLDPKKPVALQDIRNAIQELRNSMTGMSLVLPASFLKLCDICEILLEHSAKSDWQIVQMTKTILDNE